MPGFLNSRVGRIAVPTAVLTVVAGSAFAVATQINSSDSTQLAATTTQNISLVKPVTVASATPTPSAKPTPAATTSAAASPSAAKVTTQTVVKTSPLSYSTVKKTSADLTVGKSRVLVKGKPGLAKVTYKVTLANGTEVKRQKVSTSVVTKPVNKVVLVGTKSIASTKKTSTKTSTSTKTPTKTSSSTSSATGTKADGLNWAALAKCESGGNPRAVNAAGYYGLYQFSLRTWRAMGGSGNPINASPAEQTKRAKMLYNRAGVGQWPHCGPRLFT